MQDGSSPRVWGIRFITDRGISHERFIPTRVGNTLCRSVLLSAFLVHPHACGEYYGAALFGGTTSGSSPRVWGIPQQLPPAMPGIRFIPTRVGNTLESGPDTTTATVHPHACGEYWPGWHGCLGGAGSSPRVWGIPARVMQSRFTGRFIPTRVGNTFMPSGPPVMKSVHPHACGEYWSSARNSATPAGSSPRVWGIQWSDYSEFLNVRFIPTRVGNTRVRSYQIS